MGTYEISLCMIVRDEARHMERCLSSAAKIVSEIIVIDTGSTDGTPEIAKKYGATVVTISWEADFSKARNVGLELATKGWILVLDADEELVEPEAEYLQELLLNSDVHGYFVKMISFVGETAGSEYVTDSVCRLFRNDPRIRFTGFIHEEVIPSILNIPQSSVEFSQLTLRHYGYLDHEIIRKQKSERNLSILLDVLQRHPTDHQLQYALGTEFYQLGEYEKALSVFKEIIPHVPVFSGYASDLLLKTAYALRETGCSVEALQLVNEGLTFYPDFTDLLELKAILLFDAEQYQQALAILSQAIQAGDISAKYTSSSGAGTYRSHYLAGLTCEQLYLWEEACNHYRIALTYQLHYLPAWQRWPILCLALDKADDLLAFFSTYGTDIPPEGWRLVLLAAVNTHSPGLTASLLSRSVTLSESDPLLYAITLAQMDKDHEAAKYLTNLLTDSPSGSSIYLYLAVLYLKTGDKRSSFFYLEKLSLQDPSFSAIAGRLRGEEGLLFEESAYRKCQQSLIQVGAWEGLLWFQNQLLPSLLLPLFPPPMLYGLFAAPLTYKQLLLRLCEERMSELTYSDSLFAGWLASECGEYGSAYSWFAIGHQKHPEKVAPLLGIVYACSGAARNKCRQKIPSLSIRLQLLLLS